MISSFHKIKNAKGAYDAVASRDDLTVVERHEELGYAMIGFTWNDDASMKAVKGVDHFLTSSGFEELDSDSELGGTMRYEWDKQNLTERELREQWRELRPDSVASADVELIDRLLDIGDDMARAL